MVDLTNTDDAEWLSQARSVVGKPCDAEEATEVVDAAIPRSVRIEHFAAGGAPTEWETAPERLRPPETLAPALEAAVELDVGLIERFDEHPDANLHPSYEAVRRELTRLLQTDAKKWNTADRCIAEIIVPFVESLPEDDTTTPRPVQETEMTPYDVLRVSYGQAPLGDSLRILF